MRLPDSIHRTANTVFLVDPDGQLLDHNAAYLRFAEQNDGVHIPVRWGRGCNIYECTPDVLREEMRKLYGQARSTGVVNYRYQCHSPEKFRVYNMRLIPFKTDLVVSEHSLLIDSPMTGIEALDANAIRLRFVDVRGIITQCCSCRKVRHAGADDEWSWVESLFTLTGYDSSSISHGLCPVCLEWLHPE